MSGVQQGTVLGPLLFSLHINDIMSDIESEIRLFADDCVCSDLLKPVTVLMSVTVLSRVVTGFVDTVTAMSRVVTGHLLGCHGLSRVLLKLSRECNWNVTEMSQLFLETSRVHKMYCTNVIYIMTITGTSTSREKTLAS